MHKKEHTGSMQYGVNKQLQELDAVDMGYQDAGGNVGMKVIPNVTEPHVSAPIAPITNERLSIAELEKLTTEQIKTHHRLQDTKRRAQRGY
jgi:hypothetical protein